MKRFYTILVLMLCFVAAFAQQNKVKHLSELSDEQLLKIAKQHKYGIVREADPEKAARIYLYLAKKNNAKAINELGKMYVKGDGVEQNAKVAYILFRRAAKLGHIGARCNMAMILQHGLLGYVDCFKAYRLYKSAADSGNVRGMYGAGYLKYKGIGTHQNYEKAIKLLKQGAEKHHSGCSLLLASYYANGYGEEQNLEESEKYLRQASRDGNSWTVDITKNAVLDSIAKRISKKGTWTDVKNKVLVEEAMPKIRYTVDASEVTGVWSGKAYSYDYSRKHIVKEEDIQLEVESIGDSVHIKYYVGDSIVAECSPWIERDMYYSNRVDVQRYHYKTAITRTIFNKKDDYLLADITMVNLKNTAYHKPLLAVLKKVDTDVTDDEDASFVINKITYSSGKLTLNILSSEETEVDINVCSILGLPIRTFKSQKLEVGDNNIVLATLLSKNELANVVTVNSKAERHSKKITVVGNE